MNFPNNPIESDNLELITRILITETLIIIQYLYPECGKSIRGLGQRDYPKPGERMFRTSFEIYSRGIHVLRSDCADVSVVELRSLSFRGLAVYMLNTSTQFNIKETCVKNNISVNINKILQFTEITENMVNTFRSIEPLLSPSDLPHCPWRFSYNTTRNIRINLFHWIKCMQKLC